MAATSREQKSHSNPDFPGMPLVFLPSFFYAGCSLDNHEDCILFIVVTNITIWLRWKLSLWKWSIFQCQREAQSSMQHRGLQSKGLHTQFWKGLLTINTPTRMNNSSSSRAVRTCGHWWSYFHIFHKCRTFRLECQRRFFLAVVLSSHMPPAELSHFWTQKCSQHSMSGNLHPPVVIGRGDETHLPPACKRFLYVPSLSKFMGLQLIMLGRNPAFLVKTRLYLIYPAPKTKN